MRLVTCACSKIWKIAIPESRGLLLIWGGVMLGTIPCIDLRKEDLDGPSSLVRMCVKID